MPVSGTHPDALLASEGVMAMGVQLKLSARFASGAVTLLVTLGEHDWKTEATLNVDAKRFVVKAEAILGADGTKGVGVSLGRAKGR